MAEELEEKEIVIDTKKVHFQYLHSMIRDGGSFRFHNFPFGIRIRGIGGVYVNIELFTIPSGTEYKGQKNPSAPKKVVHVEKVETQESDEIVM